MVVVRQTYFLEIGVVLYCTVLYRTLMKECALAALAAATTSTGHGHGNDRTRQRGVQAES